VIRRLPVDPDERDCPFIPGCLYQRKLRGIDGRPTFRVLEPPIRQRLRDVTRRDALAEGFTGARALQNWRLDWVRRHDRWWRGRQTASDAEILERWWTRHADRFCWVLVIALIEKLRQLAPQPHILAEVARRGLAIQHGRSPGDGDEYTSGQTIDREAEAVDEATLTRIVAGELRGRAEAQLSRRDRRRMRRERLFGDAS
jgi:hypothetical protein